MSLGLFLLDGRVLDNTGFYCLNVRISRLSELDLPLGFQGDEGWRQEAEGFLAKAGGWHQNELRKSPE